MAKCKICSSKTSEFLDKQFEVNYFKCEKCQFIFRDDEFIVTAQKEKELYDYHENSLDNQGYVEYLKDFFDKGVMPFKSKGKLLDFGSGPEPVLRNIILRDYEFEAENYDLYYQSHKIYEGKKYDVVTSTEVIEHLSNPLEVFTTIDGILKDHGIFSVMTLYHYNNIEKFNKWWYRRDQTHISFYNDVTLEYIGNIYNWKIIYNDNKRICTFLKE